MLFPHVSLSFHKLIGGPISTLSMGIRTGVYTNVSVFENPPVTGDYLDALLKDHDVKYAAFKTGGSAQKGAYYASRELLINCLDRVATYVDAVAAGNVNTIELAGFTATSDTQSRHPVPEIPTANKPAHGVTGELLVSCKAVSRDASYGCIITETPLPPGVFQNGILNSSKITGLVIHDVTQGRKKTIPGFTPGIVYHIYFYAGNSAGVSGLSDAVTLMAN